MTLGRSKVGILKHRSNQFVVKSQHFIQKLTIFNVVALLIAVKLHCVCHKLLFSDRLEG